MAFWATVARTVALDPKLVSPKEPPLFVLGLLVSGLFWVGLVVGTLGLGLLYALFTVGFLLIAHSVFLAVVRGNGIRVGPDQLPDLHRRLAVAAQRLGLQRTPELYLFQSHGVLNAFATKLLSRRFVILNSALADACQDPLQLDFVLGHEVGHLAAGHLSWNGFLLPFRFLPWLGAAYSRAREYTGDRCGLAVVQELEPAMRGLAVLAAGGRYAGEVNLAAFAAQREESGRFWMATTELMSSHPFLCKRVAALQELVHPGTVRTVPRTPLAYPLAPILGMTAPGSTSGVLLIVLYLGILVAVAVPNFIRKRDELLQMQSQQQMLPFPPDDEQDGRTDDEEEDDAEDEVQQPVPGSSREGKTYRE
jgi:Zn-dependent protease with chaperone function